MPLSQPCQYWTTVGKCPRKGYAPFCNIHRPRKIKHVQCTVCGERGTASITGICSACGGGRDQHSARARLTRKAAAYDKWLLRYLEEVYADMPIVCE